MRVFLSIVTSGLVLGLGTATSMVQSQNHALAARLDDRQRKLELTRMFILNAEATILASEARPAVHGLDSDEKAAFASAELDGGVQ